MNSKINRKFLWDILLRGTLLNLYCWRTQWIFRLRAIVFKPISNVVNAFISDVMEGLERYELNQTL